MALLIPAGADPVTLETGLPVFLASGVATVQTLGQAGTSASRLTNPTFSVPPRGDGGDRTLSLSANGVAAVPTTVTVSLYAYDGSAWSLYESAIALIATGVATDAQELHLVAGLQYQVLVTTLTLGSATSVNVTGSLS
jgi:hypothetical protein